VGKKIINAYITSIYIDLRYLTFLVQIAQSTSTSTTITLLACYNKLSIAASGISIATFRLFCDQYQVIYCDNVDDVNNNVTSFLFIIISITMMSE
jgi:hypothetical protein